MTMVKGFGCVFKHCQFNWPSSSPNTNFFVPQYLVYTTPHVTTGDISASLNDIIQTKPVSILHTTSKLNNYVNINDKSHSFSNIRGRNHSAAEPSSNNIVSNQDPLGSDPIQCQKNTTTHITHQKNTPSRK